MTDEFLDTIIESIQGLKKQMEAQLPTLSSEIDIIIKSKVQDPQRIERILDTLLDYSHLSVGEEEFKRLNDYYATFNKENAAFYRESYEEIFE